MKCPNCDGSGIVNEPIYNKSHTLIKNWAIKKCDMCNGSGEYIVEPMTNDEWRRTCSTEEFAEWIVGMSTICTINHECDRCDSWCDEKRVVEWLKQPHTVKE